jgi:hypothetical protein
MPFLGTLVHGMPIERVSVYGTPFHGTLVHGMPIQRVSVYGMPIHGTSVHGMLYHQFMECHIME